MRCKENCGCSFCVVKSDEEEAEKSAADSYGIMVVQKGSESFKIDNITDNEQYALAIADYLNYNKVESEHICQIIEEILCGWRSV